MISFASTPHARHERKGNSHNSDVVSFWSFWIGTLLTAEEVEQRDRSTRAGNRETERERERDRHSKRDTTVGLRAWGGAVIRSCRPVSAWSVFFKV